MAAHHTLHQLAMTIASDLHREGYRQIGGTLSGELLVRCPDGSGFETLAGVVLRQMTHHVGVEMRGLALSDAESDSRHSKEPR